MAGPAARRSGQHLLNALLGSVDVLGAALAAAASAVALLSLTCLLIVGRSARGDEPLPRALFLVTGASTQILLILALGLMVAHATVEVMAGTDR